MTEDKLDTHKKKNAETQTSQCRHRTEKANMKRREDNNFRKQKLRERLRLSIYKSTKNTTIEARRQIS